MSDVKYCKVLPFSSFERHGLVRNTKQNNLDLNEVEKILYCGTRPVII